jgi:hypothetical protein
MRISGRKVIFRSIEYRLLFIAFALTGIVLAGFYFERKEPTGVIVVKIPPPFETEIGDRDISKYEFGGTVPDCFSIYSRGEDEVKGRQCYKDLERAREFIEGHFKDRRRGYVIIEHPNSRSIGTNYFFIEPAIPNDESGKWEIKISKRVAGPYTWINRNINTWYYSEVFRRPNTITDFYGSRKISGLVLRSRGVYEFVF